jgi:hypothetical protein
MAGANFPLVQNLLPFPAFALKTPRPKRSKGRQTMATIRRRRAVAHSNLAARLPLKRQLVRAATSPAAKTVYVAMGAIGLAALGVAIFGPTRFNRQIIQPVRSAVGDQAERIWNESRGLRDQLARAIDRVQNESGREKLVKSFQSWVGHFRAT